MTEMLWWTFQARVRAAWLYFRFGRVTGVVKAIRDGEPSEVEYRGRGNRVIGRWAYGKFDPKLPYRGW